VASKRSNRSTKKRDSRTGKNSGSPRAQSIAAIAKSPWTILVGSIVAVLGLVAAILGPLPDLFRDRTEPSSLTIESTNSREVTQFVLPVDAPLEEMPYEDSPGCSESALKWLDQHGVRRPRSYLMSIRNKAADGAMLSVKNVRVIEKQEIDPEPSIIVDCPSAGLGDTAVLNINLDKDEPALLVDQDSNKEQPFAFNLQPGEEGHIDLRLSATSVGYSGRVIADVSSGDETSQVSLALDDSAGRFNRPGLGEVAGQFEVSPYGAQGSFVCSEYTSKGEFKDTSKCTIDQIRAKVREFWR
jgi:hypothetical protein